MEKFDFNQAAFKAHAALKKAGLTFPRSQASEVLAAALGYRTYAALAKENADTTLNLHLADAEHVLLSLELAVTRVREMALSTEEDGIKKIAEIVVETTLAEWPNVHAGVKGFVDDHLLERLIDEMTNAPETSDAQAESNADFPYMMDVEDVDPETEDVWSTRDAWSASASGTMSGDYGPDSERVFNGDKVSCSATIFYLKAGRGGLVYDTMEISAAAGDWGDEDDYRADEA